MDWLIFWAVVVMFIIGFAAGYSIAIANENDKKGAPTNGR